MARHPDGVRTKFYVHANWMAQHFLSAVNEHIPPDKKIYPLYCAYPGARLPSLQSLISYYHIEKGGYSPNLFTNQPHVAGVRSSIELPRYVTIAVRQHAPIFSDAVDLDRFRTVLSKYDYLVVSTFGASLPEFVLNLPGQKVHRDSVCTIIRLH